MSILLQVVFAVFVALGSVAIHFFIYLFWPPYWSQTSLQRFLTGAFARMLLKVIKAHKLQMVIGSLSLDTTRNSYEANAMEPIEKCKWIHQVENRKRNDPVIYYIHGGGFSLGLAASQVRWLKRLAQDLSGYRISILALDYSLAPKCQYPTQLEEAAQGFNELSRSCSRIITLGDSAGGQLSAALALHLKSAKIYGQVFISPWTELLPPRSGSVIRNRKLDWVNESFAVDCAAAYTGLEIDRQSGSIVTNYGDECMDLVYATTESLVSSLSSRKACVWGSNELLADSCERFCARAKIKQTFIVNKGTHDIMRFSAKEERGLAFIRKTIEDWLVPLDTLALLKPEVVNCKLAQED